MQKRTLARRGLRAGWAHPYATGPFDPYLYADGGDGDDSGSDSGDGDGDDSGTDDDQDDEGADGTGNDDGQDNDGDDSGAKGEKPKPREPAKKAGTEDAGAELARLRKENKALRGENAKGRVEAKDQAAKEARDSLAKELAKFLDPDRDEKEAPPDPERLMAQITEERNAHRGTATELAIYKGAAKYGADAGELADSRSFMAKLAKLDPSDEEFAKKVGAAIKQAVADNPKLKAAAPPPDRTSSDFNGGGGSSSDPDDIDTIRAERRKRRQG